MYKHSALSIKETDDRKFITSEEKNLISEISTIQNDIVDLNSKYEETSRQINELEEYVHNNDKVIYEDTEGSYITVNNSIEGNIADIEIIGNTVQDSADLSNIKSVGKLREDGLYEIELTSCGKNLLGEQVIFDEGFVDRAYYKVNLKPNTIYNISSNHPDAFAYRVVLCSNILDNMKRPVEIIQVSGLNMSKSFNSGTNKGEMYLLFHFTNAMNECKNNWVENAIEEGEKTQFEHHIESSSKIILPCQLEKVGDVSDRLFRREDDVWCVEKNIITGYLDGNESYYTMGTVNNDYTYAFQTDAKYGSGRDNNNIQIICDNLVGVNAHEVYNKNTLFGCIGINSAGTMQIRIPIDVLNGKTIKEYLLSNRIKIKYTLLEPQIIELPLDTQIQLNSFFGQTNVYMESGDVDGVIKCKVSKSLGGSINSLNEKTNILSNRIEKIETLQVGNEISISTDKGYVLCEDTRDGYIKDIKIEGNTLVNLVSGKIQGSATSYDGKSFYTNLEKNRICAYVHNVKTNTVYTVVSYDGSISTGNYYMGTDNNGFTGNTVKEHSAGIYTINSLNAKSIAVNMKKSDESEMSDVKIIIIEGDHTSNPPEYFEGLLSTGQDGNMFIKTQNKNLGSEVELYDQHYSYLHGTLSAAEGFNGHITEVEGNTTYRLSNIHSNVTFWDRDFNFISGIAVTTLVETPINCKYIRYAVENSKSNIVQVEVGNEITDFILPKLDKKQILYKNNEGVYVPVPALRRINDSIKDTIEKHSDGKYYYHKRCEEIVLDGSENWYTLSNQTTVNTIIFYMTLTGCVAINDNINILCDKFINKFIYTLDEEGTFHNYQPYLFIRIKRTKLSSENVTGFKEWLSNNPTTVVYQLANEEVYECNDIELNSYDNETLISIDSGAIPPSNISFKTTSHIGNIISSMKEESCEDTKFREELTESVALTKEFDNGFEVFEDTKEGIVSIDKIEGNTLVNLAQDYTLSSNTSSWINVKEDIVTFTNPTNAGCISFNIQNKVKPNTLYTVIVDVKQLGTGYINVDLFPDTYQELLNITTIGRHFKTFTTPADISTLTSLRCYVHSQITGISVFEKPILLEGNHVERFRPNNYFNGLKSVGDIEDCVELISSTNNLIKNDFKQCSLPLQGTSNLDTDMNIGINSRVTMSKSIKILKNTKYTIDINNSKYSYYIGFGDHNNIYNGWVEWKSGVYTFDSSNYTSLRISIKKGSDENITIDEADDLLFLSIGANSNRNNCNQNSKQILYKNSNGIYEKPILRGIPNGVKDTIEKHSDGKYYYHKRCGEVVLNGIEDWRHNMTDTDTHIHFWLRPGTPKTGAHVLNDKFKSFDYVDFNTECFFTNPTRTDLIYMSILKSKLSSNDVLGFKQWLSQNPATVVYELATEEIYECNNLDLSSYDNETGIILNTSIPAKVKATVKSNLADTANSIRNRINFLENKIMEMFRLVLSGNTQSLAYELYPQDFVENEDISDSIIEENTSDDIATLEEL